MIRCPQGPSMRPVLKKQMVDYDLEHRGYQRDMHCTGVFCLEAILSMSPTLPRRASRGDREDSSRPRTSRIGSDAAEILKRAGWYIDRSDPKDVHIVAIGEEPTRQHRYNTLAPENFDNSSTRVGDGHHGTAFVSFFEQNRLEYSGEALDSVADFHTGCRLLRLPRARAEPGPHRVGLLRPALRRAVVSFLFCIGRHTVEASPNRNQGGNESEKRSSVTITDLPIV